jgi:nucleotide-binding universal stress UspA family protein
MNINTILVVTDLSAQENMAVQRAWHLADRHRATVKLMYMPAHGQQVPGNASTRLAEAARQLEERLEIRVKTAPVKAQELDDLVAQAKGMDLVVLPHRHERSTAAFFRGQPVLRLLRCSSAPVLVARRSAGGHYARILVSVDFSPESQALVKVAANLDPQAQLEIFHAISTLNEAKLRSAEATELAVRAYRQKCLQHARQQMLTLTDSFDARRNRVSTVIGRGDPGKEIVVQQEHCGADLVVVGKKRSSAWEDFLCGSVAHRVLSWGRGDVLIVPHASARAAASITGPRMRRGQAKPALDVHPAGRRLS